MKASARNEETHGQLLALSLGRDLLLRGEPRQDRRDLRRSDRVVPERAGLLGREREDVRVQPLRVDGFRGTKRRETAECVLARPPAVPERRGEGAQDEEEQAARRLSHDTPDRAGRPGADPGERDATHESLAGPEIRGRQRRRQRPGRPPRRIERQLESELLDGSGPVGEEEVVVERVAAVRLDEDSGVGVRELVHELRIVERRVARPAAPPAERARVLPRVLIHLREIAADERMGRAVRRDPRDRLEPEVLPGLDAEDAFAAVPVAGETHRLPLDDVKRSVGVEARADVDRGPRELARPRDARGDESESEKESHPQGSGHPAHRRSSVETSYPRRSRFRARLAGS